jgi:hypothetical protein
MPGTCFISAAVSLTSLIRDPMTAPGLETLQHVTLATGHMHSSPRAEVGSELIATLRPVLESALRGQLTPVPASPGYTLSGAAMGRCCAVTLWVQASEAAAPQPVPVVTMGIAADGRCGTDLWDRLHAMATLPTGSDGTDLPAAPWCAVLLHAGASMQFQDLTWFADLERCLAWTWVEMIEERARSV